VTGAKEWYAATLKLSFVTARQAPAPRGQWRVESASVTVTASNEGKSERKGSHEASLWCGVCVDYCMCLPTALPQARPHATAELLLRLLSSRGRQASNSANNNVLEQLLANPRPSQGPPQHVSKSATLRLAVFGRGCAHHWLRQIAMESGLTDGCD